MVRVPPCLAALLLARLAASTSISSVSVGSNLRSVSAGRSFARSLEFKHRLRICNAYPYSGAIDVFHGRTRITDTPLLYKSCGEYEPVMRTGDKLIFKVGDATAGSFAVAELPKSDAVLVLVVYRHSARSTAVTFESHVFSRLVNAQIAVLDTYRGGSKVSPRIQDVREAKTSRSEELRYDSVVAVNPGIYEVVLQGADSEIQATEQLVALNRESYIVVRCGLEVQGDQAYPESLLVFPRSDPKALTGAARRVPLPGAASAALLALLALLGPA